MAEALDFLKEFDKQCLLDRYLDIEWCEDITSLQCVRCHRVAIIHYVSNCQHIFCGNCKHICSIGACKCHQCQQNLTELDIQDWDFEIKIHQTIICCPNKKYGCKYSGTLRKTWVHIRCFYIYNERQPFAIKFHLRACPDTVENNLPKELHLSDTTESMLNQMSRLRSEMYQIKCQFESHFSQIFQKSRETELKFEDLQKFKSDQCEMMNNMISKTNLLESTYTVANEEMQQLKLTIEHLGKRIFQLESCLSNNLHQHIDPLIDNSPGTWQQNVSDHPTSKRPKQNNNKLADCKEDFEVYKWKISDFPQKFERDDFSMETEIFQLPGRHFGIKIKLGKEYLTSRMKISIQFVNQSSNSTELNLAFSKIVYVVSKQNDAGRKKDFIRVCPHLFNDIIGFDHSLFEETLLYQHQLQSSYYLKNNQMKILVYFYSSNITHFESIDGKLSWKVDNYLEKKKLEKDMLVSCHESKFFYTKVNGYLVQLQITLNSELIMVKILFLNGKFDSDLSENFKHKTIVTIVNHQNHKANVTEEVCENHAKSYSLYLGKVKAREGFIHDDSIFIHVQIQPIDEMIENI